VNFYHCLELQDGWCDTIGSVEDIQTKLLKRQEAAAKRERAMAYALTHQVVYPTFTPAYCINCYSGNKNFTEAVNHGLE
jgi:hypothetical protein